MMGAALGFALACLVVAGWYFDLPELTSLSVGLAATSVPTAICFALLSIAVFFVAFRPVPGAANWIGRIPVGLVLLTAIYVLATYGMNWPQAGFLAGPEHGQMSQATALSFLVIALAALSVDWGRGQISATLVALGLVIIELDLVGYFFDIDALYAVAPFTAMALPTAFGFALLLVALTLARPNQGWLQYALRDDQVGLVFRVMVPAVILLPLALTSMVNSALEAQLFRPTFGLAILVVSMTTMLSGLVVYVSAWLSRIDQSLQQTRGELQRNTQMLTSAMGAAEMGAVFLDVPAADGRVEWSAEAYRIFGVAPGQFDGTNEQMISFIHPDDLPMLRTSVNEVMEGGQSSTIRYRIIRPDGAVRWVRQQSRVMDGSGGTGPKLVALIQDITDSRTLEQQLVQAQKMEAVGNLTGGMAHDINNLLGVIIGNLDLLPEDVNRREDSYELIENALNAALRGADLMKSLLAFARRQPLQPVRVEPNELVQNVVKLLRRTLGQSIEITLDLSPGVGATIVDPSQLEASIANLASNARDAMKRGGKLNIATSNRQLDEDYASNHVEVTPGEYVMIEVSDDGSGMAAEVRERVFEPFFTTKEQGKGTGLGLSMVFGFVKQSGGHINAYSEPGVGTTFRLYLPKAADGALPVDPVPVGPETISGAGEVILVVEDNLAMRQVVVRQLSELGYTVMEAATGAEALDLLASDSVDLMFTDIVMPGRIDGLDLAKMATEARPNLQVVLTSGFPEVTLNGRFKGVEGLRLLSKPYRRDDLARVMREALAARSE